MGVGARNQRTTLGNVRKAGQQAPAACLSGPPGFRVGEPRPDPNGHMRLCRPRNFTCVEASEPRGLPPRDASLILVAVRVRNSVRRTKEHHFLTYMQNASRWTKRDGTRNKQKVSPQAAVQSGGRPGRAVTKRMCSSQVLNARRNCV